MLAVGLRHAWFIDNAENEIICLDPSSAIHNSTPVYPGALRSLLGVQIEQTLADERVIQERSSEPS
jgi:hypothetical protein